MGNRLLIVDSDRPFLKEHQVSLESAFEVEVVNTPEPVMARLESGEFAAVMICVEVADNRGYALCASVRRNPKLAALKVILISAKATEDEYKRHQTLKGKADLYLMKPITPGALVAALTPLVPSRGVDPDNPLGDLAADLESDNDWLGDLKERIEEAPAPPAKTAGTVAISGDQIRAALAAAGGTVGGGIPSPQDLARSTAPPTTTKSDMVQKEVEHLTAELKARDQKLKETEEALASLQRQLNSVTVNLDELERRKAEAAELQRKLQDAEAALQKAEQAGDAESLRAQVREAIQERQDLLKQIDALNQQLTEKTQRTIELIKERDRLQSIALEAEDHRKAAESSGQELQKLRADNAQLNTSLEQMSEKLATLEKTAQEAKAGHAAEKERADGLKTELGGMEATMRGQGRELAELGATIANLETRLKAAQAELQGKEEQFKVREDAHAALQRELTEALARQHESKQALDESKARHEAEKLELMSGMDAKEAELGRLKTAHGSLQETHTTLEREKQGLQGQLAERQDRIKALGALLEEVAEKLRQGSGLTKD